MLAYVDKCCEPHNTTLAPSIPEAPRARARALGNATVQPPSANQRARVSLKAAQRHWAEMLDSARG